MERRKVSLELIGRVNRRVEWWEQLWAKLVKSCNRVAGEVLGMGELVLHQFCSINLPFTVLHS